MKYFQEDGLVVKSWCEEPEMGAVQQALNLARLPFAFHHICLMPDTHQGYGMPIGGVMATKMVVVPNAVGVDIGCFVGSTSISLLDGTEQTLKYLYDNKVENFYVYSIESNGRYAVGKADKVKLTRKNAELIKITLDNGYEIICTPDQLFLSNEDWTEAKDFRDMFFYDVNMEDTLSVVSIRIGGKRRVYRLGVENGDYCLSGNIIVTS